MQIGLFAQILPEMSVSTAVNKEERTNNIFYYLLHNKDEKYEFLVMRPQRDIIIKETSNGAETLVVAVMGGRCGCDEEKTQGAWALEMLSWR